MSTLIETTNHFLFADNIKKNKYRPSIKCVDCINSDTNKLGPNGRIYCIKYNMYTYCNQTCKAGIKKE